MCFTKNKKTNIYFLFVEKKFEFGMRYSIPSEFLRTTDEKFEDKLHTWNYLELKLVKFLTSVIQLAEY